MSFWAKPKIIKRFIQFFCALFWQYHKWIICAVVWPVFHFLSNMLKLDFQTNLFFFFQVERCCYDNCLLFLFLSCNPDKKRSQRMYMPTFVNFCQIHVSNKCGKVNPFLVPCLNVDQNSMRKKFQHEIVQFFQRNDRHTKCMEFFRVGPHTYYIFFRP